MHFDNDKNFIILKNEVVKLFEIAIRKFCIEDEYLFDSEVQERARAARLAMYLREQLLFAEEFGIMVDVEYNRDGKDVKRPIPFQYNEKNNTTWIAPDIIIHERGSKYKHYRNDIVCCEIKNNSFSNNTDVSKIKEQIESRKYQYGVNLYKFNSKHICLDLYIRDVENKEAYIFDFQNLKLVKQGE